MVFKVKNKPKRAKRTLDEDSSDSENSIDGIENRITVGDDSTLETSTTSNGQVETSTEFPVSQRRRRGGLMYGELTESEKATGRFRFWNFQFKEREESEKDGDAVVLAHYRTIKSFTASDPELTSTGEGATFDACPGDENVAYAKTESKCSIKALQNLEKSMMGEE